MVLVKIQKTRAYFKRFQVKFRRRREGKTDYYARKRLVTQAKNKYNTPKFRLVARVTNKDIIAQLIFSTLTGDKVVMSAYAHELKNYGLNVGLTNYAACYCVGLLLARRVLKHFKLDSIYAGQTAVDGEMYHVEEVDDKPRPFRAFLDIGLARTSKGARIFGVLKGACDGGMNVPHSNKRFPGYNPEDDSYNAGDHRDLIFGKHVSNYMRHLEEDDDEAFKRQFSRFIKEGITADGLEGVYAKVHKDIRANPDAKRSGKADFKPKKRFNQIKLTYEERVAKRPKIEDLQPDSD